MTHTVQTAAKAIGCHPETVKRLCRKHGIGELISGKIRILTAQDVAKLRKLKQEPGRPNGS